MQTLSSGSTSFYFDAASDDVQTKYSTDSELAEVREVRYPSLIRADKIASSCLITVT